MKDLLNILLGLLLLALSVSAIADWPEEKQKIDFLLAKIESSQMVFVRNGKEYSSAKASEHLRTKLKNAQSSWFSPKKHKWTAIMFINKIATKSSLSGKFYWIKLADGSMVKSQDWLMDRLAEYKKASKNKKTKTK